MLVWVWTTSLALEISRWFPLTGPVTDPPCIGAGIVANGGDGDGGGGSDDIVEDSGDTLTPGELNCDMGLLKSASGNGLGAENGLIGGAWHLQQRQEVWWIATAVGISGVSMSVFGRCPVGLGPLKNSSLRYTGEGSVVLNHLLKSSRDSASRGEIMLSTR